MKKSYGKPETKSNPLNNSEPSLESSPSDGSEPRMNSKPSFFSVPAEPRKPLPTSEPIEPSNPGVKSEPRDSRNPFSRSEPLTDRNPAPESDWRSRVRNLVEIYYDVQDVRIRSFNRLRTVGEVQGVHPEILRELEKQIRDYIQHEIKPLPVVKVYLRDVKGIGPILAGGLVCYLNPHKADHASSFWKYTGMHVEDGKAVKREKGKKLGFNVHLRTLMWKVADSFIKQRTPFYRDIYDNTKEEENKKLGNPIEDPQNCPLYSECIQRFTKAANRKGKASKKPPCKMHIHNRAKRKMVKRFLADLWGTWRALEGLPVTPPYMHRKLAS